MNTIKSIITQGGGVLLLIACVAAIKNIPNRSVEVSDTCKVADSNNVRVKTEGKVVSFAKAYNSGQMEIEAGGCSVRVIGPIDQFGFIKDLDLTVENKVSVTGLSSDGMINSDGITLITRKCGELLTDKVIEDGGGPSGRTLYVWVQMPDKLKGYPEKFTVDEKIWFTIAGRVTKESKACVEGGKVKIIN